MKFCPNCGQSLPDDAGFCGNCGAALPNEPAQSAGLSVPPAPAVPAAVADTIGAGDTHAGMLLGCLYQGMALDAALGMANRAAAAVVARHGADILRTLEELL